VARILAIEKHGWIQSINARGTVKGGTWHFVSTLDAAWEALKREKFDVVIWDTDSEWSGRSILTLFLRKLSQYGPRAKTFIISDSGEPPYTNLKTLSCDWVRRPISESQLLGLIGTALERMAGNSHKSPYDIGPGVPTEFEGILAISLPMHSIIQQIVEAAAENVPVLVSGETGTGKDLVAAAIHKRSKRNAGPFLPVNMGAIASELIASELFGHEKGAYTGASEARAGFFEQAHGGTVFLDEITTMDEKTQISLLRVLETKTIRRVRGDKDIKVDVRVIAATNENIEELVRTRRFREDLYYRLDVFRIHIPPLRERHSGAVSLLTDKFVVLFDDMYRKNIRVVSPDTYRLLRRYSWPGNVRELKNVIQRAVLMAKGTELTPALLPARIREMEGSGLADRRTYSPIQLGMSLEEVEKEFIQMTLTSVSGNKMKAASILGISRRALYNKLKRHGLL